MVRKLDTSERQACENLWDYLGEQQSLNWTTKPFDAMIVAGGRDLGVPKEAARLFLTGWAKQIVISGGYHRAAGFHETEKFTEIVVAQGVPDEAIIRDYDALHTGHNVRNSQRRLRELSRERSIEPRTLLAIHTPIMTRRLRATIEAQWEGQLDECATRHQAIDFETYSQQKGMEDTVPRMIGYVARMEPYAAQGLQSEQIVPEEIHEACALLMAVWICFTGGPRLAEQEIFIRYP